VRARPRGRGGLQHATMATRAATVRCARRRWPAAETARARAALAPSRSVTGTGSTALTPVPELLEEHRHAAAAVGNGRFLGVPGKLLGPEAPEEEEQEEAEEAPQQEADELLDADGNPPATPPPPRAPKPPKPVPFTEAHRLAWTINGARASSRHGRPAGCHWRWAPRQRRRAPTPSTPPPQRRVLEQRLLPWVCGAAPPRLLVVRASRRLPCLISSLPARPRPLQPSPPTRRWCLRVPLWSSPTAAASRPTPASRVSTPAALGAWTRCCTSGRPLHPTGSRR